MYQKLPSCHDDDILLWWKQHSSSLPRLSILAKQILAIPATTSCSERLFSTGGLFDTPRRGRLLPESLEILTLLKTNRNIFETFKESLKDLNESDFEVVRNSDDSSEEDFDDSDKIDLPGKDTD